MEVTIVKRHRNGPPRTRSCGVLVRWLGRKMELGSTSCCILFCDDREIESLNHRFLRKTHSTDVLSFPDGEPASEEGYLGDIAISVDTAKRQAMRRNHSVEDEIHRLVIHGFLHLLGFDHEIDKGEMSQREISLRKGWIQYHRPQSHGAEL